MPAEAFQPGLSDVVVPRLITDPDGSQRVLFERRPPYRGEECGFSLNGKHYKPGKVEKDFFAKKPELCAV